MIGGQPASQAAKELIPRASSGSRRRRWWKNSTYSLEPFVQMPPA
jgi:hypothetical protein